jgi:hypothetical protein
VIPGATRKVSIMPALAIERIAMTGLALLVVGCATAVSEDDARSALRKYGRQQQQQKTTQLQMPQIQMPSQNQLTCTSFRAGTIVQTICR